MKVVTLAAGVAVGYVLGTRAGREKYEQIVAGARKVSSHPTVVQAQTKAKELIGAGTGSGTGSTDTSAVVAEPVFADSAVAEPLVASQNEPLVASESKPRRKPVATPEF